MIIALVGASKNLDNFDELTIKKLNLKMKYLVTNSTSYHYNKYKNKFNAKVLNYKEFLNVDDYDCAYISTTESNRYDISKNIIKKKDLIFEKNFLLNQEKEIEISQLSKIYNKRIYQSLITKFNKQYETLKKNYFQQIGIIKHVNIYLFNPLNENNNYRLNDYLNGGILNDYLEYILDILGQITSDEKFEFKIIKENINKNNICTSLKIFFYYKSGLTAFVFASYDLNKRNECEIIGNHGSIKLYHPITFDKYQRIKISIEKSKIRKKINFYLNKIYFQNKFMNQMYHSKNIVLEEQKPLENMFNKIKSNMNKNYIKQLGFVNINKFHEIKNKVF